MELKLKYWKDESYWVGYLELFPDYWTQGKTENELQINLQELHTDLTSGVLPKHVKN